MVGLRKYQKQIRLSEAEAYLIITALKHYKNKELEEEISKLLKRIQKFADRYKKMKGENVEVWS